MGEIQPLKAKSPSFTRLLIKKDIILTLGQKKNFFSIVSFETEKTLTYFLINIRTPDIWLKYFTIYCTLCTICWIKATP